MGQRKGKCSKLLIKTRYFCCVAPILVLAAPWKITSLKQSMLLQPYHHSQNSRSQQLHARNQGQGPNVFLTIYHTSLITSLWITWVQIPGSPFLCLASGKKLNTKERKTRASSCPKILLPWVHGWNSNSALQWGHSPLCPRLLTSRIICFPSLCLSSMAYAGV